MASQSQHCNRTSQPSACRSWEFRVHIIKHGVPLATTMVCSRLDVALSNAQYQNCQDVQTYFFSSRPYVVICAGEGEVFLTLWVVEHCVIPCLARS
eukprot:5994801-Amphidinium_carterae.1